MAHTLGRNGNLTVGGTDLGGIVSMSFALSHETADATDFDSVGYKENDYAESQATISIETLRDEADTAQDALRSAASGKTTVSIVYEPYDNAGADRYSFTAHVTSLDVANARGELVTDSWELLSSGSITFDTQ